MIKSLVKRIIGLVRKPLVIGSPAANALVIAQIADQGDDGTEERHVRHLAYPRKENSRDMSFAVDLLSDAGLAPSESSFHGGVMGEHQAAVATPEFDELTEQLREGFAQIGWEYDGWECAVRRI